MLELPLDRSRPPRPSYRGAMVPMRWQEPLVEDLHRLARDHRATLFMVLLAGWQVLLARYAGCRELTTGTPIANRTRVETEGLIGLFVNTLVLRTDLSDAPTFAAVLERVRESALAAYEHQEVPFEQLVDGLVSRREMSVSPLFQVFFQLQNAPVAALEVQGLKLEPWPATLGTGVESLAKFDLTLALEERGGELRGGLQYARDLFDRSTVQRQVSHLRRLLEGAVANPRRPLAALEVVTPAERHQLLREWAVGEERTESSSLEEWTPESPVHRRIAILARRRPERTAVAWADGSWSYGELRAAVEALASRLAARGIGRGDRVGVCLERGPWLLASLLAVLETGAAYVPLDPQYPGERLIYIQQDAGLRLVLTTPNLEHLLASGVESMVPDGGAPEGPVSELEPPDLEPTDLAYIIYTSGSTGVPKGVAVPHRGVINFLDAMAWRPGIEPEDLLLSVSSASFDITVLEFYLPLLHGARVFLVTAQEAADGLQLRRRLESTGATLMQATPATWRMLRSVGWQGSSSLRTLCGAEAMPGELAEELTGSCAELWNLYGPTETTVWSSAKSLSQDTRGRVDITIGRPVAGTRSHILGRDQRPLPAGAVGELVIGGAGVVWGYWGLPARTAEVFVPDPWSPVPGGRMYRTGDLGRWRGDGDLLCLGRIDQQVKVRGHRIEPGEIETVLGRHPGVQRAVVTVHRDPQRGDHLVAYWVAEGTSLDSSPPDSSPPEPEELRAHARRQLPESMIPSLFQLLPELPLTPSGKIDRRALPEPQWGSSERGEDDLGERLAGPQEEVLRQIFSSVLGIERIRRDDDFFALGGHSLLATQVMARVNHVLGQELPLRTLFEAPSVGQLAQRLRAAGEESDEPIVPVPREADLPLSFEEQRLWVLQQMDAASSAYNMPLAFRAEGPLRPQALEGALRGLVRRHEILHTVYPQGEGGPERRILPPEQGLTGAAGSFDESFDEPPVGVVLPVVDLSAIDPSRRDELGQELARRRLGQPFDLQRGPLIRTLLLRLGDHRHRFLLAFHHIVTDGWSLVVTTRDLVSSYRARVSGEESALAPLPVQYADFAAWQHRRLTEEALARRIDVWRQRLRGAPTELQLPPDRPRTEPTHRPAGLEVLRVPRPVVEPLEELARAEGATLFMAALAAFQVVVFSVTGQREFLLASDVANRGRLETEDLVGFFINQVVLRCGLDGEASLRQLLETTRRVCFEAYADQDLPFNRLVEGLKVKRQPGVTPLVQVCFNFQNLPPAEVQVEELTVHPEGIEPQEARFDLVVNCREGEAGLACFMEYDAALFDAATVRRWGSQLQRALELLGSDPDQPVAAAVAELEALGRELAKEQLEELKTARRPKLKKIKRRSVHKV
ncbi:MAG: amino acid adenylation domain-containing protein [Acidobacteriota bacterium]|nr:amino acid adenylation domain-containing protein [Acidobacteriota bacterium]